MSITIVNNAVKVTDQSLIAAIQAFMADKHSATGAELIAGVPALASMPRNEQEQAVDDSGFFLMED